MSTDLKLALKTENRWICWKAVLKDNGKTDKLPVSPYDGETLIDITDFSNASSYIIASTTAETSGLGIGVLLGDGLSCIDLDDCVKEEGVSDRANEIINHMDSYTEFSPSGLGIHIFYYGEKPGSRCRMKMEDFEIEIYEKERFITFTETMVYGSEIEHREEQIVALYNEVFGEDITVATKEYGKCENATYKLKYALKNDKLLKSLWEGKRDDEDESRNDLAIIGKLCYWLQRDPKIIHKAILKSPYYESKDDKRKTKFRERYDNYFIPTFEKANDALEEAAWDWEGITFTSGEKDKPSVDKTDLNEANKELLFDPEDELTTSYPWLHISEDGKSTIYENTFSEWLIKKFELMCINGVIYNENGEIPDAYVKHKIQDYIKPYISNQLARTTGRLFEAVVNDAYKRLPRPKADQVHVKNTTLSVTGERIKELDPKFTINRLNVTYDTEAKCEKWLTFLSELVEPEYIPILQEYMGYCLCPTNVAQVACFIVGNGGEGKSIVVQAMQKILGRNQMTGQIHKLSSNNFMLSNLENKLCFLDDDINLAALDDTSTFKQIVTNNGEMMLERKNKQAHSAHIYAKILACGNGSLKSKYDKSDGFYRRLMIIKCKKKDEQRVDDKMLHIKILDEVDGIFLWMLEGLQRLMRNGWYFSKCDRISDNINELKEEIENIRLFLKDRDYVAISQLKDEDNDLYLTSTISEIDDCYRVWCDDNSYDPMSKRKVSIFMKQYQEQYGIKSTNKIKRGDSCKRGYRYIQMKASTLGQSGNLQLARRG